MPKKYQKLCCQCHYFTTHLGGFPTSVGIYLKHKTNVSIMPSSIHLYETKCPKTVSQCCSSYITHAGWIFRWDTKFIYLIFISRLCRFLAPIPEHKYQRSTKNLVANAIILPPHWVDCNIDGIHLKHKTNASYLPLFIYHVVNSVHSFLDCAWISVVILEHKCQRNTKILCCQRHYFITQLGGFPTAIGSNGYILSSKI